MDLIEASITVVFLVVGALGALAAVLHMRGWLPKAYIARLEQAYDRLGSRVGVEVENALERVALSQEAKYTEGINAQMKSAEMSVVRGVGVEKQFKREVDAAMAEAILGPAKPLLMHFAPGLLETLERNPSLLPMIIEHPLFQKYVAPRLQAFLGQQGHLTVEGNEFQPGLGR